MNDEDSIMMINWSDDMKTGVDEIDNQHKELISQLNKLAEAIVKGKAREDIGEILDFTNAYARMHFSFEEQCMEEYSCPVAAINKKAHEKFVEIFDKLKRQFELEGPTSMLTIEVQRELIKWFSNHILKVDTQLNNCEAVRYKKLKK